MIEEFNNFFAIANLNIRINILINVYTYMYTYHYPSIIL